MRCGDKNVTRQSGIDLDSSKRKSGFPEVPTIDPYFLILISMVSPDPVVCSVVIPFSFFVFHELICG